MLDLRRSYNLEPASLHGLLTGRGINRRVLSEWSGGILGKPEFFFLVNRERNSADFVGKICNQLNCYLLEHGLIDKLMTLNGAKSAVR